MLNKTKVTKKDFDNFISMNWKLINQYWHIVYKGNLQLESLRMHRTDWELLSCLRKLRKGTVHKRRRTFFGLFWQLLDQMPLFKVLRKCHLGTLSKICLRLSLSKCLSKWIKVDKWDYLKNPSHKLKNSFCLGFLWIPRKTGRQNWRGPIF